LQKFAHLLLVSRILSARFSFPSLGHPIHPTISGKGLQSVWGLIWLMSWLPYLGQFLALLLASQPNHQMNTRVLEVVASI
jgi:hypothetical protein